MAHPLIANFDRDDGAVLDDKGEAGRAEKEGVFAIAAQPVPFVSGKVRDARSEGKMADDILVYLSQSQRFPV